MVDETEDMPSVIEYSMDLAEQEAPPPLPAREYVGTIKSAVKKISQRGTSYAEVAFHIPADQYPADFTEGNPEGTTLVFRRVSLEDTPQARYGTRRFIEAIGAPLGRRIDLNEWLGRDGAVEVTHETYEGTKRAVINRVRGT